MIGYRLPFGYNCIAGACNVVEETLVEEHEWEQGLVQFAEDYQRLRHEIGKVIVGQDDVVNGTLVALIAGGHVLLEGVPGLGKTLLVRTLAEALQLQFQRIQFTPDLMPADVLGTNVIAEAADRRRHFEFQQGPVFANIVLADEINRATPKTQSALLEAMQEGAVTVAGETRPLPSPFLVLATQNPLEMEGTYPLPEAQLDRFLSKLLVRFPSADDLASIVDRTTDVDVQHANPILCGERIVAMRSFVRQVPIAADVRDVAIRIVLSTHPDNEAATERVRRYIQYGSSPRGAQAVILGAKVAAVLDGRSHVAREDLLSVAHAMLRHRLILNFEGQAERVSCDDILDEILQSCISSAG